MNAPLPTEPVSFDFVRLGEASAYPSVQTQLNQNANGLTKREYFAAMALRCIGGMAIHGDNSPNVEYYQRAAACAVVAADALLAALKDVT